MNVSGTLNAFKLLFNPSLCLPHASISNFSQLPIPLSTAFNTGEKGELPDIRAVVLDKDNCFARPKENEIYEEYHVRKHLPYPSILVPRTSFLLNPLGSLPSSMRGLPEVTYPDRVEQRWHPFRSFRHRG